MTTQEENELWQRNMEAKERELKNGKQNRVKKSDAQSVANAWGNINTANNGHVSANGGKEQGTMGRNKSTDTEMAAMRSKYPESEYVWTNGNVVLNKDGSARRKAGRPKLNETGLNRKGTETVNATTQTQSSNGKTTETASDSKLDAILKMIEELKHENNALKAQLQNGGKVRRTVKGEFDGKTLTVHIPWSKEPTSVSKSGKLEFHATSTEGRSRFVEVEGNNCDNIVLTFAAGIGKASDNDSE